MAVKITLINKGHTERKKKPKSDRSTWQEKDFVSSIFDGDCCAVCGATVSIVLILGLNRDDFYSIRRIGDVGS